jgi:hypothetical protein
MSTKKKVLLQPFKKTNHHVNLGFMCLPVNLLLDYFDLKDYCTCQRVNKSWNFISSFPFSHNVYATEEHSKHLDFTSYVKYITHIHEITGDFLAPVKTSNHQSSKISFISRLPRLQSLTLTDNVNDTWMAKLMKIKTLTTLKVYFQALYDINRMGSQNWQYGEGPINKIQVSSSKLYLSAFPKNMNDEEFLQYYSTVKVLKVSIVNLKTLKRILSLPLLEKLTILDFKNDENPNDVYAMENINWIELPCPSTLKILNVDLILFVGNFICWFTKHTQIVDLTVSQIINDDRKRSNIPIENKMLDNVGFLRSLKGRVLRKEGKNIYYSHYPDHIEDGVVEKHHHECCFYLSNPQYFKSHDDRNTEEEKEEFNIHYRDYEDNLQKELNQVHPSNKLCFHKKLNLVYPNITKVSIYHYIVENWKPEDFIRQFPNLELMRITYDNDLKDICTFGEKEEEKLCDFVLQCLKLNSRLYVKLKYHLSELIVRFPLVYASRIYN